MNDAAPAPPEWLEIVRRKVAAMRFGTVQIVVHDGRVTLVESTEKTRVTPTDPPPQPRARADLI